MRLLPEHSMRELNHDFDAQRMVNTFPRLKHDFEAIKTLREMYARLGIEAAEKKRASGSLGRRVAHIPPPLFVWLSQRFPEVLRNKQLLRAFLRANPHLLLVERL